MSRDITVYYPDGTIKTLYPIAWIPSVDGIYSDGKEWYIDRVDYSDAAGYEVFVSPMTDLDEPQPEHQPLTEL